MVLCAALVLDFGGGLAHGEELRPVRLLCEGQESPLGVDGAPRLGWILESDHRAENQTGYEVQVASSAAALQAGHADMWNSGRISSDQSALVPYGGPSGQTTLVPYAGKPLKSHSWYFWRVRIWDGQDHVSGWSQIGRWATGVLHPDEWRGAWIASSRNSAASVWFRSTFELKNGQPASALCSIASVGYHELYVNGRKVGDDVMAPAISDLSKRALSVTRDLAPYLRPGTNSIGVWLGQGWAGHSGKSWYAESQLDWPSGPSFVLQTQIQDGSREVDLASGPDWKCHRSNMDSSNLPGFHSLGGEAQDDRTYIPEWNNPEFNDSDWPKAVTQTNALEISPQVTECNRIIEELRPVAIREKSPGVYQADMGRHFSGWIKLEAERAPGARIEISMSEREDQSSSYGQTNLLILGPEGRSTFRNHFKHQSGRWITVQGLSEPLQSDQLKGYAISTGTERIGQFSCSNELYNRIYETVLWTFRQISMGGYVVDCPHRERMGYGDSINAVEGAMLAFDTERFFTKWSRDWSDVQQPDGSVPFTAPTYNGGGGPMWSSTLVHLPWLTYLYFGDPKAMEENYPAIQRWMNFLATNCQSNVLQWFPGPKNIVQPEWSFLGDWVYPGHHQAPNGHDPETLFMNNCYYLHTLKTAARIAHALGHPEDAARFQSQADAAATSIQRAFWDPQAKSYPGERQTTPASALFSGLPPADVRPVVADQLAERVLKKHHLDTGILGTYFMIEALTAEDRCDLVDCVANTTEPPGWGAMLALGATCIWEQWDGDNSRCHSSYLSIGAWFIKGILGLRPDPEKPGFRHFIVKPGLYEKLGYARGEYNTLYGKITCAWKVDAGHFTLDLIIPANTSATIFLPSSDSMTVTESGQPLDKADGVRFLRMEGNRAVLEAGSGSYHFDSPMPSRP